MDAVIGLVAVLLMVVGFFAGMGGMSGASVSAGIVGSVLFTGGLIALAVAVAVAELRRLRKTMEPIATELTKPKPGH